MSRRLGIHLAKALKQPVFVESMPGAGGVLGTENMLRAPADGYTIAMVSSNYVVFPHLYKNLSFDAMNDMTPIAAVATTPMVLVARADLPARNVAELKALALKDPGKLNLGSSGNGTILHLMGMYMQEHGQFTLTHVPYKGVAPFIPDLISGLVDVAFFSYASVEALVKQGRLKVLAVSSAKRQPNLPDVAAIAETHNQKNLNRSVADSLSNIETIAELASQQGIALRAAIATAFGCPFEGNVDVRSVVDIAQAFTRMGIQHITLADTTGMATPSIVRSVCASVRSAVPEAQISLHFHNTRGLGLLNVAAGIDVGIADYESSVGGIGGCPFAPGATGNICTEDLVHFLQEEGHSTGIDLDSLIRAAWLLEEALGRPLPGQVMRSGKRLRLHDAEAAPTARAR